MKGDITQYEREIIEFFKTKNLDVRVDSREFNSFSEKTQQCKVSIITEQNQTVSQFSLIAMPGCCGVVISTGSFVYYTLQGQGIGKFLHKLRIKIARDWGYGLLLCTDVHTNSVQNHILAKYGWESVKQFRNPRTGNSIDVQTLNLNPSPNTYTK